MKSKIRRVSEVIELGEEDLFRAWKEDILTKSGNDAKQLRSAMTRMVNSYLSRHHKLTSKSLKFADDFSFVEAEVEYTLKDNESPPTTLKKSKMSYTHRWGGFYQAAANIFKELRSKKKDFVDFDAFYDMLISIKDSQGRKLFVKEGVPIDPSRVKQYLSPSQLPKQKLVKGVSWDRVEKGIRLK